MTYEQGEFVSNLLFTGVYNEDIANFSGVVKVCEDRAQLNDSTCARSTFDYNEFLWPEQCNTTVINFTGSETFGITNPLNGWEYTVKEASKKKLAHVQ